MNRIQKSRTLGIMVCMTHHYPPFAERLYYEQLTEAGKKLGITIVVFSPKHIHWPRRQVQGYIFDPAVNKWLLYHTALPAVVYDRCFYLSPQHYKSYQPFVQKIRQDQQTELLGVPLKGKWQLTELVNRSALSRYFPHTVRYTGPRSALNYLQKYDALVAKPSGGSHGRGIVALFHKKENGFYYLIGRTKENASLSRRFADVNAALTWLHRFIGTSVYIVQPYLHLRNRQGQPFDIRALMQKDGRQRWQLTGMAVRTGNPHSLTSNLHGGGKAEKIDPFLEKLFTDQQTIQRVEKEIQAICYYLPPLIEEKHGRLCELGIDIGIDSRGRVWLLEVNSKPGRQVFRQAGEKRMYYTAIHRPVVYAHSLLQGTHGLARHRHS